MKKLKFQKALLGICLALSTTITMSNATNATQASTTTQDSLDLQKSGVVGDKKSKKRYDTYTEAILAYTRNMKDNTKFLTNQQHIDFLSQYIDNRLITYLALMIQTKYKQVPQLEIQNENPEQLATIQYNLLRTEPTRNQTKGKILNNPNKAELIIQFLQQLDDIEKIQKEQRTQEQKILSLLFLESNGNTDITSDLKELTDLITNYTKDENSTLNIKSSGKTDWLIYLNAVAKQLEKEAQQLKSKPQECMLPQLAQLVKTFCQKWKKQQNPNAQPKPPLQPQPQKQQIEQTTKLNQQEQPQPKQPVTEQQPKQPVTEPQQQPPQTNQKTTLTQTISDYLTEENPQEPPTPEKIKQLLQSYIKGDKYRYLASMLLTNFVAFLTENTKHKKIIIPPAMFLQLYNNKPDNPTLDFTNSNTDDIQQIYKLLADIRIIQTKSKNKLTTAERILSILFTPNPDQLLPNKPHYDMFDAYQSLLALEHLLFSYSEQIFKRENYQHEELINTFEKVVEQLALEEQQADIIEKKNIQLLKEHLLKFSKTFRKKKDQLKLYEETKEQIKKHAEAYINTDSLQQIHSQTDNPIEKTNLEDTFYKNAEAFIQDHTFPFGSLGIGYRLLPREHIRNDIAKYLALLIQANFKLTPTFTNKPYYIDLISANRLYQELINDPLQQRGQGCHIILNEATNEQIVIFLDTIRNIINKDEALITKEEKILRLLFSLDYDDKYPFNTETPHEQLRKLIEAYTKDPKATVNPKYLLLLSYLGPAAQQLLRENKAQNKGVENSLLEQLANLVRDFSAAYIDKLKTLKQSQQQKQLNKTKRKTRKSTHTRDLQLYVKKNKPKELGISQYQQFLEDYIKNNTAKYLAVLILARYNLIQFPKNTHISKELNSNKIYKMLSNSAYKGIYPKPFPRFLQTKLSLLSMYQILNRIGFLERDDNLEKRSDVYKILTELFIPAENELGNNASIDRLQDLIQKYDNSNKPTWRTDYDEILRLLGDTATQLQKEVDDLNGPQEQEQLQKIVQQIQTFFHAYENELQAQEEVYKKGTGLNEPKQLYLEFDLEGISEEQDENNIEETISDDNQEEQESISREEEERKQEEEKERLKKETEELIEAANSNSNPANMTSNATYEMSKDEEQTIFAAFKNAIESNVQPQSKTSLSDEEKQTIKGKIQKFINNNEAKALALYIANEWDIIDELGRKNDEVDKYVSICLSGLYNLTQKYDTITINNALHSDIAKAINNLLPIEAETKNKLRNILKQILHQHENLLPLHLCRLDTQGDREAIQELKPEEKKLIRLLNSIAPAFRILAAKKPNNQATTIIKLIDQIRLPYYTYNSKTPLTWFLDNAHLNYEPDGLKGKNLSVPMKFIATLYLYRPELLLSLQLSHNIGVTLQPEQFTDRQVTELEEIITSLTEYGAILTISEELEEGKQNTQLPPIQQIYQELAAADNNYHKTNSKYQHLMAEFLYFLIGLSVEEPIRNYNNSTIFQRVEETSQQAAQDNISIKLTHKQKELLTQLEKAYKEADETTYANTNWQIYAKKWFSIHQEIIRTVLSTVSKKGKIKASQIAQELERHRQELQKEEKKYKEQEEERKQKEEIERQKKTEELIEGIKNYFNQNKGSNSNLTTTQKIINNLSATNNMIQIIMQILD